MKKKSKQGISKSRNKERERESNKIILYSDHKSIKWGGQWSHQCKCVRLRQTTQAHNQRSSAKSERKKLVQQLIKNVNIM